ncbi:hypothetical protein V2S66_18910 [Streptomyces sp. V4-01]|uniref:Uncharacterized protein n=1 Tax=Actinacidiphila polyblastidii TaxID=3110430 RepID=A0ABU7PDZ4_9ACTN|nr:hypothetical protein [Streptomyces sp. V4-01]
MQVVGGLPVDAGAGVTVVLGAVGGGGQQHHDPAQDTLLGGGRIAEDLAGFVGTGRSEVFGEPVDLTRGIVGEINGEGA